MTFLFYLAGPSQSLQRSPYCANQHCACLTLPDSVPTGSGGYFLRSGRTFCRSAWAIVYAGAILVLFLFVIMMLNLGNILVIKKKDGLQVACFSPPGMSALLLGQLLNVLSQVDQNMAVTRVGVMEVSALLFGPYVLAVELASILLLAGWFLPIISRSDSGSRQEKKNY